METPVVRPPAVAGRFYPARPEILKRDLMQYLNPPADTSPVIEGALGCLAPHAGYMYSGHVAGAVFRRLPARSSYIILCPNHTGRGEPLAVMSSGAWQTPLGEVPVDHQLALALREACSMLMEDAEAHANEHALEVQLPFLQLRARDFRFVPIAVGVGHYGPLEALGHAMALAVKAAAKPVLIVASSDMNHYEPDALTRVKDQKAIDRMLALDPQGLYDTIRRQHISMCGYGPAIAMLTAALDLGAKKAELVRYATSADMSGDRSAVVGYAGVVVS